MRGLTNSRSGGGSNLNLLDNWDFTNPVNQRGISVGSKQTATGYFLDRWINAVSTGYKIIAQGLQLYANSDIYQNIDKNLLGKTLTFSISIAENIYATTFKIPPSIPNDLIVYSSIIADIEILFGIRSNGTFYISIRPRVNVLIAAAKLEKGEVSTLKNDALGVSYAEELRKCQRYYYATRTASSYSNNATSMRAISNHDTVVTGTICYPVRMRTIPTIAVYSFQGNIGKVNDGANGSELDVTASVYNQGDDSFNQMNLGRSLSEVTSTKEVVFFFIAEADL